MLPSTAPPAAPVSGLLVVSALLIATCGLIYELVAGALASYLLGDSITQFSLVIGAYLSAMGLGSYLSKFIDRGLVSRFVEIEIAVALIGGFEAPMLFAGPSPTRQASRRCSMASCSSSAPWWALSYLCSSAS
jgi:spermidine synthase